MSQDTDNDASERAEEPNWGDSGPRSEIFRGRGGRRKSRGVLPRRGVRTAAFGIISLSIFACGALCLLAVWDYAAQGVPWRAITSLGIVAGTMGAFAFVNELFGEAEANDALPAG